MKALIAEASLQQRQILHFASVRSVQGRPHLTKQRGGRELNGFQPPPNLGFLEF